MATPFGGFQSEIYLRGTTGERPPFTTDLAGLEDAAHEALPPEAFGYVAGSAGAAPRPAPTGGRSTAGGSSPACCATWPSAT